jgi:hypothetical protein
MDIFQNAKYRQPEGKVRGERYLPARDFALFGHFQDDEEKKRFVGSGISPGTIDPQCCEFMEPIIPVFGHRVGGA